MTPRPLADHLNRWQPTGRDLADAAVIDRWRLASPEPGPGPFLLHGVIAGKDTFAPVIALDARAGWARLADRWVVLGERAPGPARIIAQSEIVRRAAEWSVRSDQTP